MERILIGVEPDEHGWRIQLAGITLERNLEQPTALGRADDLARERHASTGLPTAVHMRMLCGDRVMLGMHG
ncbi:hypothetical protein [Luteimonas suaedae]|uniref:hypothetical protein n=1 Tax=Luteimonas suaedae TaxID=2605430 RepID=UPI0011EC7C65|nr:hypothetical protein [Luteimonas suaedae]